MSYRNFNIDKKDIVAITGAGGKTSLIFFLAKKLAQFGKVLITTTTKMYKPSMICSSTVQMRWQHR